MPARHLVSIGLAAALLLIPARAQEAPAGTPSEDASAAETASARKARLQAEKEARIAEYLRKKEEKRARKEQARSARDLEREQIEEEARRRAIEEEAVRAAEGRSAAPAESPTRSRLPRDLALAQENVRLSGLGSDPTVQEYLDLIDRQGASPEQLAAFGNFVAENGMVAEGLAYYEVALRLERNDPLLWVNVGTLHRQLNDLGTAMSAYRRALSLDPNQALAHYNIGAIRDLQGKYDQAVNSYRLALRLDPGLGDPSVNPQAASNELLLAAKMLLYQEQSGALGLPLAPVGLADSDR